MAPGLRRPSVARNRSEKTLTILAEKTWQPRGWIQSGRRSWAFLTFDPNEYGEGYPWRIYFQGSPKSPDLFSIRGYLYEPSARFAFTDLDHGPAWGDIVYDEKLVRAEFPLWTFRGYPQRLPL
jgi:hypothetical protein